MSLPAMPDDLSTDCDVETQRLIGEGADRRQRVIRRHSLFRREVAEHVLHLLVGSTQAPTPFVTIERW